MKGKQTPSQKDLEKHKESVAQAKKKVKTAIKKTDKAKKDYDKIKEGNDAKIKKPVKPITNLSDAVEYVKQSVGK